MSAADGGDFESGQVLGYHLSDCAAAPPGDAVVVTPLTVFVNYRRADTGGYAWALYFRLAEHVGADNVFFDSANLRPGTDWFAEIAAHVETPGVFLALIGREWEASVLERMRASKEDIVVKELSRALRCVPRVTVIPLLVNGAAGPLPLSLKTLGKFQVETLQHAQLSDDIDRLLARIDALRQAQPVPATPRGAQ